MCRYLGLVVLTCLALFPPHIARASSQSYAKVFILNHSVQKELHLNTNQILHIKASFELYRMLVNSTQPMGLTFDRHRNLIQHKDDIALSTPFFWNSIEGILQPEQLARYEQIRDQRRSLRAMLQPVNSQILRLTPAQYHEIQRLMEENLQVVEQELKHSNNRMRVYRKISEIQDRTLKRESQILTLKQMAIWKIIVGEPFQSNLTWFDVLLE